MTAETLAFVINICFALNASKDVYSILRDLIYKQSITIKSSGINLICHGHITLFCLSITSSYELNLVLIAFKVRCE